MLQITISRRGAFLIALALLLVIPAAAFAGSVFNDVDDTDTHIDGITFVKDSGVSVGCDTNNNYCPQDNVTRAQMATFMYRLSGNDPATPPSVVAKSAETAGTAGTADAADDSALLAGAGPLQYTTQIDGIACADASGCADATGSTLTEILQLPISVPANGVAALSYSVSGSASPAGTNAVQAWLTLDDDTCGGWFFFPLDAIAGTYSNVVMDSTQTLVTLNGETVIEATAGAHTVSLCLISVGDDWTTTDGAVTSIWSASGSGTSTTSGSLSSPEAIESALSN